MISRKTRRRLVAYADAGLSDNSAIGHAVASGLNETWQRGEAGESWLCKMAMSEIDMC